MASVDQPITEPPAINGVSSTTNGDGSACITDQSQFKDRSQLQSANSDRTQSISADEIALYDRQIRLWGVKAQERLRTANVLLITMRALANEIAKNLVLAGIGSLTLQDSQVVVDDDIGAQFFISEIDIGKNV